tara:strand:- start:324 stop:563 length:240 start_codon:yes stop_codon:yes gene_type:complete
MAYKLLGSAIPNPSDEGFSGATLVHVVASANVTLTVKSADSAVIGTIHVSANSSIDVVKNSTDTISCDTSICTPIAYHW